MDANELKYLSLLSKSFPTIAKAQAEIINLNAILNLPKATEVYATDVHGEYEAFVHLLRNGSGAVRIRIDEALGDSLTVKEKNSLATLIYYPREKMDLVLPDIEDKNAWYSRAILLLVRVSKVAAGKYTRSKVRKALPKEYAYIIEELMTESNLSVDKKAYYSSIIDAVIRTGCAEELIEACLGQHRTAASELPFPAYRGVVTSFLGQLCEGVLILIHVAEGHVIAVVVKAGHNLHPGR